MESRQNSNFNLYTHENILRIHRSLQPFPGYCNNRFGIPSDRLELWINDHLISLRKGFREENDKRGEGGKSMSWRYAAPQRCDFDSQEEYEEAISYYEEAADLYADEYFERTKN